MPISDGFMGNATSGIGQGLAYVLPATKTEDYAMQLAQQYHQEQLQQQAATLKRNQEVKDQIAADYAKAKIPKYYAPFGAEVNKRWTGVLNEGAENDAKTGKSSWSDPNFQAKLNEVATYAQETDDFGKKATDLYSEMVSHADLYTPESVEKVFKHINTIEKDPVGNLKTPFPMLEKKRGGIVDFDKTVTATAIKNNDGKLDITKANEPAIQKQVIESLYDPQFKGIIPGYDDSLGNFPMPDTKTGLAVWPTGQDGVNKIVNHILTNPQDYPHLTSKMDFADRNIGERLGDIVKNQNGTYGPFVNNRKDAIAAKVTEDKTLIKPDNYEAHLKLRNKYHISSGSDSVPVGEVTEKIFTTPGVPASKPSKFDSGNAAVKAGKSLEMPEYVTINATQFKAPQIEAAYDIQGKKMVPLESDDYWVTGVGYAKDFYGAGDQLKVTVKDKKGKEYALDIDKVSNDVMADKTFKAGLEAVQKAHQGRGKQSAPVKKVEDLRKKYNY